MISETSAPPNIKDFHLTAQQLPAESLRRFESGCVSSAFMTEEKELFHVQV